MSPKQIARRRWSERYLEVLRTLAAEFQSGSGAAAIAAKLFHRDWPQIRAAQAWAAASGTHDQIAWEMCVGFATCGSSGTGAALRDVSQPPLDRIRWLEAGLAAARSTANRRAEAVILYDLGLTVPEWYGVAKSIEYAMQARQLFHELGDYHNECAALNLIGLAHTHSGSPQLAVEHHEQSLAIARAEDHQADEVFALRCLADVHARLSDAEKAGEHFEIALAIVRRMGDMPEEVAILTRVGKLQSATGNVDAARDSLSQAASLLSNELLETCDDLSIANELGLALVLADDSRGLTLLNAAVAIFETRRDFSGVGRVYVNLGIAHFRLRQCEEAAKAFEHAIARLEVHGPRVLAGLAHLQLARCHVETGNADSAAAAYADASRFFREIGDQKRFGQTLAEASNHLGWLETSTR